MINRLERYKGPTQRVSYTNYNIGRVFVNLARDIPTLLSWDYCIYSRYCDTYDQPSCILSEKFEQVHKFNYVLMCLKPAE